jgi:hypothetical protein
MESSLLRHWDFDQRWAVLLEGFRNHWFYLISPLVKLCLTIWLQAKSTNSQNPAASGPPLEQSASTASAASRCGAEFPLFSFAGDGAVGAGRSYRWFVSVAGVVTKMTGQKAPK